MDQNSSEHNKQPEIPESNPGFRAYLSRPVVIAAITIAAAASICLIIALLSLGSPDNNIVAEANSADQTTTEQTMTDQKEAPVQLYEEPMEDDLDDMVKQIDLSLINTLKTAKISMGDLRLEDVSLRKHQGHDYHFQQLSFPVSGDKNVFLANIQKGLDSTALNASMHEVAANSWLISINGVPTHKFSILAPKVQEKEPAPAILDPNAPKMAIVIDDMGEDIALAKGLAALDAKITFSIWPNSSHVKKTIAIAKKSGNEIMVHLPMEPKGYPKVNPGNDALLVSMNADKISSLTLAAIAKVPGAVGLNNHMGSRFTEFYTGMDVVMTRLSKKKIFFLDSRTTPKSAGRKAAIKEGVTFYARDIFLDNVKDVGAIKYQLSKTAKIARKRGQAIAIGHPNRETLKAIRQWIAENKGKVRIVPVSSLRPKG
ncbi:divergent polysaccharide deacetylase family protein [Maridesulfovibrio sp.]|uniref:divergent polysaccharide deacetylase family protein n=1 Tax=Maridesulfovibrio sp. TaxID=2795000 RepID=UPI0029F4F83F|nr:divergent polysaccharide deacetylase family protein [Maridesulfovibrio sp.]